MNNKKFIVVPLTAALLILGWWQFSELSKESDSSANTPGHSAAVQNELAPAETAAVPDGTAETALDSETLQAMLAHPRVQDWLQREEDKHRLENYFKAERPGEEESQAVWELIETLERESRVMATEALAMKLAWLEKNASNELEFRERADALIGQYRQKAEQNARVDNPENDPRFIAYKSEEARIVAEVKAMQSYPDGMSQQAYLRQRLLEARQRAYGS